MGDGESIADTSLRDEAGRLVELLGAQELEELPFFNIHDTTAQPGDIEAALQGTFRLRNERFALVPPVDWWDEPYTAPNERGFFQNSFVFADPLLSSRDFTAVLKPLAAIFADWISANPRSGATNPHRYAWHDHAAASRLVVMAFVLREGIRRQRLDRNLAEALATGILEHAGFLIAKENYVAQHNHGLFSDAALALAARSLAPAPQAVDWRKTAERRFAAVLEHTIDDQDALHLEHSPSYHWVIHGALGRFENAGLFEGLRLTDLRRRMEESGIWLVAPDGTLPPIGDTSEGEELPPALRTASAAGSGLRAFRSSGYGVIRDGNSALIVIAAHHPTAHKHADDGSFCLYEDGRPIVVDSGDPGHDYASPERLYGTSPAAHSTICVDGFDWSRESPPYGSGLIDAGERDGVYAMLTRNPGAVPGGGKAQRTLIYAPRRFLVVIDDVEAGPDRLLERHLPLASDLSATAAPEGEIEIRRKGMQIARLVPFSVAEAEPESIEITVGRLQPKMAGFTFPSIDRRQPRCGVTLSAPAGPPRAFVIALGPGPWQREARPALRRRQASDAIEVDVTGVAAEPLRVKLRKEAIELKSVKGS